MASITDPSDQSLTHNGVVGMKWGKRKSKASSKSTSKATPFAKNPKQNPPPAKGVTDLRPKHVKRISDVELRQRINRMQMETQYKDLTEGKSAPDKHKAKVVLERLDKGHKAVQAVLAVAKTAQTIHKLVNSDMAKEIAKLLKDAKK